MSDRVGAEDAPQSDDTSATSPSTPSHRLVTGATSSANLTSSHNLAQPVGGSHPQSGLMEGSTVSHTARPSESPACTQGLSSPVAEPSNAIDLDPIMPMLKHPGTAALEARLGRSMPEVFTYLFYESHKYDSVCLCVPDWKERSHPRDYGTYYSRTEAHLLLWTYIIKRSATMPLIEADGFHFNDKYSSKTDSPFLTAYNSLANNPDEDFDHVVRLPGHEKTAMIDDEQIVKAFRIFTHEPMKFKVQKRIGNHREPEQIVAIWCKDVEPKGCWDTEWEYMSKPLALCICPDENYEF